MADVSPLLQAIYRGDRAEAELLAAEAPSLDVFEAAALGRAEWLSELLAVDPALARAWSADGFTPLHLAAYFGHPEAASVLLDGGADVGAPARNEDFANGVTPLGSAAAASQLEVARLLLDHGADADPRHAGHTPLDAAVANGDEPLADLLRAHGGTTTR